MDQMAADIMQMLDVNALYLASQGRQWNTAG